MIKNLLIRLPKLWLILKCLALGYIAGSIHAPFGIEWRKENALPVVMEGLGYVLPLPTDNTDPNQFEDDLK